MTKKKKTTKHIYKATGVKITVWRLGGSASEFKKLSHLGATKRQSKKIQHSSMQLFVCLSTYSFLLLDIIQCRHWIYTHLDYITSPTTHLLYNTTQVYFCEFQFSYQVQGWPHKFAVNIEILCFMCIAINKCYIFVHYLLSFSSMQVFMNTYYALNALSSLWDIHFSSTL